jgi:hypothetical protein
MRYIGIILFAVALWVEVATATSSSSNPTFKPIKTQLHSNSQEESTIDKKYEKILNSHEKKGSGTRRRPHSPTLRDIESGIVADSGSDSIVNSDTVSITIPSSIASNEDENTTSNSIIDSQIMSANTMENITENITENNSMISIVEELLRWQATPIIVDPSAAEPMQFAATSNMLCSVGWEEVVDSSEFTKKKVLRCKPVQLTNIAFESSECEADTGICSRILEQN